MFSYSYFFEFKKWQCIRHMKLSGKFLVFDITNIYRNVQNPIWAFTVFQTNQSNDQQKDNNTFNHANVRNMWLEFGGKRYPEKCLNLVWDIDYCCMAYSAFLDFKRICIKSDSIPYTDKIITKIYTQSTALIYQINLEPYQM